MDANSKALGAVLYQKQNGIKLVIAYASRSIWNPESNYAAFKLEFLALKWAVTKQYAECLLAQTFIVYTDNNPLTHILKVQNLTLQDRGGCLLSVYITLI